MVPACCTAGGARGGAGGQAGACPGAGRPQVKGAGGGREPGADRAVPAARPQYGFVNHALELLVIRNYGPEVWEDIK